MNASTFILTAGKLSDKCVLKPQIPYLLLKTCSFLYGQSLLRKPIVGQKKNIDRISSQTEEHYSLGKFLNLEAGMIPNK